jgi:hypothetical protein
MVWFSFDAWLNELRREVVLKSLVPPMQTLVSASLVPMALAWLSKTTRLHRIIILEGSTSILGVIGASKFASGMRNLPRNRRCTPTPLAV